MKYPSKRLFWNVSGALLMMALAYTTFTRAETVSPAVEGKITSRQAAKAEVMAEYIFAKNRNMGYFMEREEAEELAAAAQRASTKYGISEAVIIGLMQVESGFNKYALSYQGAIGYTQIVPKYHYDRLTRAYGNSFNLYDVDVNVDGGVSILRHYLNTHKSMSRALLRYNGSLKAKDPTYHRLVLQAAGEYSGYARLYGVGVADSEEPDHSSKL